MRRVQVRGDADGGRPVGSAGRDGNEGAFQVILWIPAFAGMTKGGRNDGREGEMMNKEREP